MSATQELVAGGRIPVSFDMHDSEVTSMQRPAMYFCMAPRTSYLPLVSSLAKEAFQEHAPDIGGSVSEIWFEYDNRALRWNLPIGVLYDYYSTYFGATLPFKITMRFQGFPKANLLPCATERDVENAFFNSMKQALCLRFNTAQRLMEMAKDEQEALWDSVLYGKRFERIRSLVDEVEREQTATLSQLPLRVVSKMNNQLSVLQSSVVIYPHHQAMMITLGDAVNKVLLNNGVAVDEEQHDFKIHGISVPSDAPVVKVWEEMCYADLFLYVVVV